MSLPRNAPLPASTRLDPDAVEAAVLGHVAALHPVQITLAELVREMTDTPEDFASRDAIERAVRQLVRTGLLHQHDRFVLPTRAALRLMELVS